MDSLDTIPPGKYPGSKTNSYKQRYRNSSERYYDRPGGTGGEGNSSRGSNNTFPRSNFSDDNAFSRSGMNGDTSYMRYRPEPLLRPAGFDNGNSAYFSGADIRDRYAGNRYNPISGIPDYSNYNNYATGYNAAHIYGPSQNHDCSCNEKSNLFPDTENPVLRSAAEVKGRAIAMGNEIREQAGHIPNTGMIAATDLPQTAGAGKYSQQAIRNMAMANDAVQNALAAGRKVILVRDITVDGKPVSASQVLGNAQAGGAPEYVVFTGALKRDGSEASGTRPGFTFPDGSRSTGSMTGTSYSSDNNKKKEDCGCHGNSKAGSDVPDLINAPCQSTESLREVRDITKSTGTVGKNVECPEPEEGKDGYFYVTDKEGDDTHHASRTFFNIMNKCCGGLFDVNNKTGMVSLKKGKKPEDIDKLEASATISPILARTVMDAIKGGVEMDGSEKEQVVRMRVLRQGDDEVDNFILDDFDSGFVDLDDYQDLLKHNLPGDVRNEDKVKPIFTNATTIQSSIIQAALIGHAICERFLMKDYEKYISKKNKISKAEYEAVYRKWGDTRAGEILREMVHAVDNTWDKKVDSCEYTEDPGLGVRIRYYPEKSNWTLAILLYSSANPKKWDRLGSGYLQKKNP